ncbi:MAG: hypothetical protein ACT4NY_00270 [Pseudonocardiales bacterium]
MDAQTAALFRSADALYREKLRPLILRAHDVTEQQCRDEPESVPRGFHTDDRFAKTLLLSAVAPKVPALKEITGLRLALLNHGSVVSPLPGNEASIVLAKVKDWARTTASQNPDPAVHHLENLLPEVVLPLTRQTPVLLLIMDGMSVGVATEVMSSALGIGTQGWVEALLPGEDRRSAALAVLPTLTEVSRASLLSGTLVTGSQPQEHRGFGMAVRAAGLTGRLFHKKPLDISQPGFAVVDDVGAAIDDMDGTRWSPACSTPLMTRWTAPTPHGVSTR